MLDIHYSDTWDDHSIRNARCLARSRCAGIEKSVEEYSKDFMHDSSRPRHARHGARSVTRSPADWLCRSGICMCRIPSEAGGNSGSAAIISKPYDQVKVWDNVTRFLKAAFAASSGAGNTPPQIIMPHRRGGDWQVTKWWFDHLTAAKVDYDIMGRASIQKSRHVGDASAKHDRERTALSQAVHGCRNRLRAERSEPHVIARDDRQTCPLRTNAERQRLHAVARHAQASFSSWSDSSTPFSGTRNRRSTGVQKIEG